MWWSRRAVLSAALASLAGCGFRPMYAKRRGGGSTVAHLDAIVIDPIPGRLGQIVHNNLLDRLTPRGAAASPRYRLQVRLSRAIENLAIAKDEETTRSNLRLTANFVLRDLGSNEVALDGQVRSIASFNLVRSDYANLIAERDADRRAAREVSDQMMTRLSLYFDRNPGS